MEWKYSFEHYKDANGSKKFPNASVLLSPLEYQWWFIGDVIQVNLTWNNETFRYRTRDGLITKTIRDDPSKCLLWLFTMDGDWNIDKPSVFCIAAADIL